MVFLPFDICSVRSVVTMHAMVVVYVASIKCFHFSVFVTTYCWGSWRGKTTCTADCFYRLGYSSNTLGRGTGSTQQILLIAFEFNGHKTSLCRRLHWRSPVLFLRGGLCSTLEHGQAPSPPSPSVHTLALVSPPVEHLYTVPVQSSEDTVWTKPGSQQDLQKRSKVVLLARWMRPCRPSSMGRYSTLCWTQCRSFQIKNKWGLLSEFEPTALRGLQAG